MGKADNGNVRQHPWDERCTDPGNLLPNLFYSSMSQSMVFQSSLIVMRPAQQFNASVPGKGKPRTWEAVRIIPAPRTIDTALSNSLRA